MVYDITQVEDSEGSQLVKLSSSNELLYSTAKYREPVPCDMRIFVMCTRDNHDLFIFETKKWMNNFILHVMDVSLTLYNAIIFPQDVKYGPNSEL